MSICLGRLHACHGAPPRHTLRARRKLRTAAYRKNPATPHTRQNRAIPCGPACRPSRSFQTASTNGKANRAKKLPVTCRDTARVARRNGDTNPETRPGADAGRAAATAATRACAAGRAGGKTSPRAGCAARGVRCPAGASAVAASSASYAVRAASRAPRPSTRPSLTRSIPAVYVSPASNAVHLQCAHHRTRFPHLTAQEQTGGPATGSPGRRKAA